MFLSFHGADKPLGRKELIIAAWQRAKVYTREYLDAATEEVWVQTNT